MRFPIKAPTSLSLSGAQQRRHARPTMCGLFCSLGAGAHFDPSTEILERLNCRGPDSNSTLHFRDGSSSCSITLCSTVLSLRGSRVTSQPYQDDKGRYVLCWNGEAWRINGHSNIEDDTASVHALLCQTLAENSSTDVPPNPSFQAVQISSTLARVAGPYAFVFLDRDQGQLYFGRDFLGRRSLCWRQTTDGALVISSVTDGVSSHYWQELEADGIYCADLTRATSLAAASSQRDGRSGLPDFTVRLPYRFDNGGSSVRLRPLRVSIPAHAKVGAPRTLFEQDDTLSFTGNEGLSRRSRAFTQPTARLCSTSRASCSGTASCRASERHPSRQSRRPLFRWPGLRRPCATMPRPVTSRRNYRPLERRIREPTHSFQFGGWP